MNQEQFITTFHNPFPKRLQSHHNCPFPLTWGYFLTLNTSQYLLSAYSRPGTVLKTVQVLTQLTTSEGLELGAPAMSVGSHSILVHRMRTL